MWQPQPHFWHENGGNGGHPDSPASSQAIKGLFSVLLDETCKTHHAKDYSIRWSMVRRLKFANQFRDRVLNNDSNLFTFKASSLLLIASRKGELASGWQFSPFPSWATDTNFHSWFVQIGYWPIIIFTLLCDVDLTGLDREDGQSHNSRHDFIYDSVR